jgi:hypothetical protein
MFTPELMTESLTEIEWAIAHAIAQALADEQLKVNQEIGKDSDGIATEFKKIVTYLYANLHRSDASSKFFKYLNFLVGHGKEVGHSNQTNRYYRAIKNACHQYLDETEMNPSIMLQILGWAVRLIGYYKQENPMVETAATKNITEKPKRKPEQPRKNIPGSDADRNSGINPALARPPKPPKHK